LAEPYLKIYAERNTGSRYLQYLVDQNLKVNKFQKPAYLSWILGHISGQSQKSAINDFYHSVSFSRNFGWKHSCVKPAETLQRTKLVRNKQVKFISITKNPYSWLLSLHRRPYTQHYNNKKPEFEDFLVTPWKPVKRDNLTGDIPSPMHLWNIKNASYTELRGLDYVALRFEDLLADPERVLTEVAENLNLSWRRSSFSNYDESTKNTDQTTRDYQQYYLGERWRSKLSSNAIALINDGIDRGLMKRYGYDLL